MMPRGIAGTQRFNGVNFFSAFSVSGNKELPLMHQPPLFPLICDASNDVSKENIVPSVTTATTADQQPFNSEPTVCTTDSTYDTAENSSVKCVIEASADDDNSVDADDSVVQEEITQYLNYYRATKHIWSTNEEFGDILRAVVSLAENPLDNKLFNLDLLKTFQENIEEIITAFIEREAQERYAEDQRLQLARQEEAQRLNVIKQEEKYAETLQLIIKKAIKYYEKADENQSYFASCITQFTTSRPFEKKCLVDLKNALKDCNKVQNILCHLRDFFCLAPYATHSSFIAFFLQALKTEPYQNDSFNFKNHIKRQLEAQGTHVQRLDADWFNPSPYGKPSSYLEDNPKMNMQRIAWMTVFQQFGVHAQEEENNGFVLVNS